MDLKEKYFYITFNFSPDYNKVFQCIEENIYKNTLTGELFRKRLLYDFGWGQESGFEKIPLLTFDELIKLVENSVVEKAEKRQQGKRSRKIQRYNDINQSNLFGAISVIMEDYVLELIDFLSNKICTDYFSNADIRHNFAWFSFSTQKMRERGFFPGGSGTKSYEEVFNEYQQWRKISELVIKQVYRDSD